MAMAVAWRVSRGRCCAQQQRVADETGLIATGWDSPNAARFRAELPEFEKWGVFDGTTIFPTRKTADGQVRPAHSAFSREHWEWSEFAALRRRSQSSTAEAGNPQLPDALRQSGRRGLVRR